jgi:hypothetical protein
MQPIDTATDATAAQAGTFSIRLSSTRRGARLARRLTAERLAA